MTSTPRVIFCDVSSQFRFPPHEFATDLGIVLGNNFTLAAFDHPIVYAVEDMLAPLYQDVTSPIQPIDLVRAEWKIPKNFLGSLCPADLYDLVATTVPKDVKASLMRHTIEASVQGGAIFAPSDNAIIVYDADNVLVNKTLEPGTIPEDQTLFIRLRVDNNIPKIFDPVRCPSINLIIPHSMHSGEAAALIPGSKLVAANQKVTVS